MTARNAFAVSIGGRSPVWLFWTTASTVEMVRSTSGRWSAGTAGSFSRSWSRALVSVCTTAGFSAVNRSCETLSAISPSIGAATSPTIPIPAPPMSASPSAPVRGIRSDTKPSIVGQMKQMPSANTVAAANAMADVSA